MAKDVGTAIRKSSYCGVVSTLFGCFLGIPSLHGSSFFFMFFFKLLSAGFSGGETFLTDVLS